jgi:hypothetical protein
VLPVRRRILSWRLGHWQVDGRQHIMAISTLRPVQVQHLACCDLDHVSRAIGPTVYRQREGHLKSFGLIQPSQMSFLFIGGRTSS